jgi:hypothetical protein
MADRRLPDNFPAWLECEGCGEFYCTLHCCHTHENGCTCPAVEDWSVDPYSTGGAALSPDEMHAAGEGSASGA